MIVLKTKEIRKSKRISLSQLSYKSGVSRSYLTELEHGKYDNPGLQTVLKICKALDVDPNTLICEELWRK